MKVQVVGDKVLINNAVITKEIVSMLEHYQESGIECDADIISRVQGYLLDVETYNSEEIIKIHELLRGLHWMLDRISVFSEKN